MPFLTEGFVVKIFDKFFKIGNIEPFEYRTGQEATAFFSAVASGSTSGFKNIIELEPDDNPRHLFWVVPGIEDCMQYSFKISTGTDRFGTDVTKNIGFITNIISPYHSPNEDFGFFLIEEFFPSIDANNVTAVALTPKVYFTGFKYDLVEVDPTMLSKLQSGQALFKDITIGGIKLN